MMFHRNTSYIFIHDILQWLTTSTKSLYVSQKQDSTSLVTHLKLKWNSFHQLHEKWVRQFEKTKKQWESSSLPLPNPPQMDNSFHKMELGFFFFHFQFTACQHVKTLWSGLTWHNYISPKYFNHFRWTVNPHKNERIYRHGLINLVRLLMIRILTIVYFITIVGRQILCWGLKEWIPISLSPIGLNFKSILSIIKHSLKIFSLLSLNACSTYSTYL
jgi:hypothetical protein